MPEFKISFCMGGSTLEETASSHVHEEWHGEGGASMRCELLRHPDGCCGILQERIADASVDGLPVAWRRGLTGARLAGGGR